MRCIRIPTVAAAWTAESFAEIKTHMLRWDEQRKDKYPHVKRLFIKARIFKVKSAQHILHWTIYGHRSFYEEPRKVRQRSFGKYRKLFVLHGRISITGTFSP